MSENITVTIERLPFQPMPGRFGPRWHYQPNFTTDLKVIEASHVRSPDGMFRNTACRVGPDGRHWGSESSSVELIARLRRVYGKGITVTKTW